MSQFAFLQHDWRPVFDAASRAEDALPADPRAACFYARRALELAMAWAYKYDPALRLPFLDTLSALIGEPSFKALAGEVVVSKTRLIATLGNRADHSHRAIPADTAVLAVRELFHVGYWFARSYGRAVSPSPDLHFDPAIATPHAARSHREGVESLQQLEAELRGRDESLAGLFAGTVALDADLKRMRDEVAAARQAAALQPDRHDYEEAGTRDRVIDLLLEEAGWPMDRPRDREFKVDDGPGGKQVCVDLVFWGDDGKPLGLVETRRTRHDRSEGQRQAGLCADYLERAFGQRPVIFQSSGCRHWLWDEAIQPPREVQGFYRKAELLRLIQRRAERRPLGAAEIRRAIVGRFYQTRCIRRVAEAFERERRREALLTMASGTGKTRTVIALCDLLLRRNWVRQVLFLADGAVLVNQVVASFKRHIPDAATVNLIADKYGEGQIFVSTHAAMMGLIESTRDIQLRFGVGHFDLVVVHEAHPSVFRKYRAIFDHFDALLVGLTATPEAAVEHETYARFDLDDGAPTDGCSAEEAVRDGFLVPPRAVPAPFRFLREELGYQELSEDERDQWDALEWDEDREVADRVERESHRRALFDRDNVDSMLTHLMRHGIRVAGGDRLGKTIVFAQSQAHARFIAERFQANFPQYGGEFARAITLATAQTQNLVEHFSRKAAAPHLAISADALDIGLDIPEVVNLVFFRPVHSRSRFHQMMGRAARPCPDLFAPGKHKRCFHVFDCCHNLEYFDHPVPEMADAGTESLGKRLFTARLELIG
ncbi:MAG: DEAD/DEAH box helicase family protein, partial [Betaproteobacteria bacterium]